MGLICIYVCFSNWYFTMESFQLYHWSFDGLFWIWYMLIFIMIGVDFKVKYVNMGGKKIKLAIWDTGNTEWNIAFTCLLWFLVPHLKLLILYCFLSGCATQCALPQLFRSTIPIVPNNEIMRLIAMFYHLNSMLSVCYFANLRNGRKNCALCWYKNFLVVWI